MPSANGSNASNQSWPMFLHDAGHSNRSAQAGPTLLQLAWARQVTGQYSATAPVIDSSGNIFVYFYGGLYCLDSSGNIKGSYTGITDAYCAVGPDGNIYVFGFGKLAGLRWTGSQFEELWVNTRSVGQNWAPPTIGPDGTIYVVSTNSSIPGTNGHGPMDRAVAVDPATGLEKWHVATGGFSMSSPALDSAGNVYFGCDDGNLYSVNSAGHVNWSKPTNGRVSAAPAVDENGIVYVSLLKPGSGQGLVAVNSAGNALWNYPSDFIYDPHQTYDDMNPFATPALGPNGVVYYALNDEIHAVTWDGNSRYGQSLWVRQLDPGDRAAYLTVDCNGSLYFTTFQQKFYALDADGGLIWKVSSLPVQQPVFGPDGTLYLAGGDTVYALGADSPLPASLETIWNDLANSATPGGQGGETYQLTSDTFTDPAVWQMVSAAIGATGMEVHCTGQGQEGSATFAGVAVSLATPLDGLTQSDGQVTLKGSGAFWGAADSSVEFVFGVSGSDVTLDFSVNPGSTWRLSSTFTPLAQTFFAALSLSRAHLSQSATTSQPAAQWQFDSTVSFDGPLAPVASLIGNPAPMVLHGLISFEQQLPILSLTVGPSVAAMQVFQISLAANYSLGEAALSLTTTYESEYESLQSHILLRSSMSIGGYPVTVTADLLPVHGLTEFAGTYSQPPSVPLSALDIWGGDEDMETLIPSSMQNQSPSFTLSSVGLWVLTTTRQATAFTATLGASNWQAVPAEPGVTPVATNLAGAELSFFARNPFDDDNRVLSSKLTGQVNIDVATLAASAKSPDFPILGAQVVLENPLLAEQILTALVADSVPMPRGFPDALFNTAEMSAVSTNGNVYYTFTTETTWGIPTCVGGLTVERIGLSLSKVHTSPTGDQFEMTVGIFGTVTIADAVFGIGSYSPESGTDWLLSGPVTLPIYLPDITAVVLYFNSGWGNALPPVLSGLGQNYRFSYLGIAVEQDSNTFSVVLKTPTGADPWEVITEPLEIEFEFTELVLTCDPENEDDVTGYVRGPFPIGGETIYLKSGLPFNASQYTFNIDHAPAVQDPYAEPATLPSLQAIVEIVSPSWADNLPPALLDLENNIVIDTFAVNVNGDVVQVTINISAADDDDSWPIITGPPRFAIERLKVALRDNYDGSAETLEGEVSGSLPAGESWLPLQTPLTDDWSSFTVSLDSEALSAAESKPSISDIVSLFDPSWVSALPSSVLGVGGNVTIQNFDLDVSPAVRTARARLENPSNWPGWSPLSSHNDIKLSRFELDLGYDQPGGSDNPSGRLQGSATILGEAVNLVQVLPDTKLTGHMDQQVLLRDVVYYLTGGSVPDYMQEVEITQLVVQIDPAAQTLTIQGRVAGDITIPRNDEGDEIGECEGEYPEPPDSVLKNGRLNAVSAPSGSSICIAGDFMWNTGVTVPGQLCDPFTSFVPSITGTGSSAITFPPPVDPTAENQGQPPDLSALVSQAQGMMSQGLTEADAVFLLSQQQGLSPQQSIQTLFELSGGDLLQLPTITTEFTDIYPGMGCDPDETTEDVVEALENLPSGPVEVTPELMTVALIAAFPGITAAAIAAALLAAGLTAPPSPPNAGELTCAEVAADMASSGFQPAETARVLVSLAQCEEQTSTAEGLSELLSTAYPEITLADLAGALAAGGFAAADVAAALVSFAAAAGIPLTAEALADLLIATFGVIFTPVELADILVVCGFPPVELIPVFTAEPPIVPGVPTTAAGMAALLVAAFGTALTCSDLADSLALTPFDLISVTTVLHDESSLCGSDTASAADMAALLFDAYGTSMTCADLADALAAAGYPADEVAPVIMQNSPVLCSGQPQSIQELSDLLNQAYVNPALTLLELAAALAAAGFAAAAVAAVIADESEDEDEPGTAEELAEMLEETYGDSLTCMQLGEALAGAGFNPTEVALALKDDEGACASETATAAGMGNLLLDAYPSITCQDMANALAACGYDPSEVAPTLKRGVPSCLRQTEDASGMAEILLAAYTDPPLTCEQLAGALGATQYPLNDVAALLTQSPYNSLCGTQVRTAVGLANLLMQSYPPGISCTSMGEALAAAGYGAAEVAYVLAGQGCDCMYPVTSAANMAVTLSEIYGSALTCEQLAQALAVSGYPVNDVAQELMNPSHTQACSQQTSSAAAFAQLLYDAYPAHGISPGQMTGALASVGFPPDQVGPVLIDLYPGSVRTAATLTALLLANYPSMTCSQLAAALAAAQCDVVQTAIVLQQQSMLCEAQSETAEGMATLLYSAFGSSLTCSTLAQALAATRYPVDDVAVVLAQQSTALCSGQPQSANDLALLLVSAYTNPSLTCAQIAGALCAAGYSPTQVALVVTQQPPICADQPENAAALARLLQDTFTDPPIACTDLAAALAAVPYSATQVAVLLRADSAPCSSQTESATDMATLLLSTYTTLSCQQLGEALARSGYDVTSVALVLKTPPAPHQSLCSGMTGTASAMASLIQACYAGVGVSAAQMAQALAACGFAATDVAPLIYQLYPDSTTLAYYMAAILLGAYGQMSCSSLAAALAAVPYDPDDVAHVLLQPPPPYTTLCAGETSTAAGMAALLSAAYPSLTCQQLGQALAGAQYNASDVATVLKAQSSCSDQTATASGMAALLNSVFTNPPLTCDQLADALAACGYSPSDVAVVLKQQAACTTQTQTASGMAALLLGAYSSLTCTQLADALAAAGYDSTSVAVTLKNPPNNATLCADQTATAGGMTVILTDAYGDDLTEQELEDALDAAGYPQEEIDDVIDTIYGAGGTWSMFLCNARHTARSSQTGPSALNVAWSKPFNHLFNGIAVDADGYIYFGTSTSTTEYATIYCVDPSGNTVWTYNDNGYSGPLQTPAIGADGTIYGSNGKVFAVHPVAGRSTQSAAWQYNPYNDAPQYTIWSATTPPIIGSDGTIYAVYQNYTASSQNILAAINPNGTKKWWYTIPVLASTPAIAPDGTIILALQNGQIYAISPADGTANLLYNAGPLSYGTYLSPPTIKADGTIYIMITGSSGRLMALTPGGTPIWPTPYSGGSTSSATTVGIREDGVIYAGFGMLHAVTPDGEKLWQSSLDNYVSGVRAMAIDSVGKAYFSVESEGPSGQQGNVAVDSNGNQLWNYSGANDGCAPAMGPDGTVYFGDRYGNLIAVSP